MTDRYGSTSANKTTHLPHPARTLRHLVAMTDDEMGSVDPVEVNLLVAKGTPALEHLDIPAYQRLVDEWADDFARRLPGAEHHFRQTPGDWKNDIRFFRLGVLCWFLANVLKVRYKEDQRNSRTLLYTNASDMFLNGLIDTRQGTCGSLPVLFLAIAWRLKWPVSLISARTHLLCRYDDGEVSHNIEATNFESGFRSPPDEYVRKEYHISERAIRDGSDLCTLSPKQALGWYLGLRGRHHADINKLAWAEKDYLFARALFPENYHLYNDLLGVGMELASHRFEPHEKGHPATLTQWLTQRFDNSYQPASIDWTIATDSYAIGLEGKR